MSNIPELRDIIRRLHGVEAMHVESVPVKEEFQGQTVWDGIVEIFDLTGHPTAHRAYAWSHDTDDPANPRRHVTVLHEHPVKSAETLFGHSSFRSQDLEQQKKAKKVGGPKLPKGAAKGRIVPVRFRAEDLKAIKQARRPETRPYRTGYGAL